MTALAVGPKRWLGLLLALIVSSGVGHFYLGLRRRALVWFGLQTLPALLLAVVTVVLEQGSVLPYLGIAAILGGVWLAQLVDLLVLEGARFERTPMLHTVGYAVLVLAASRGTQLLAKTYLVEAFSIPSGGMVPTLLPGDHIMVDKTAGVSSLPALGEVVVFEYRDPNTEHDPEDHVKRVLGVPGDVVAFAEGHPSINGQPIPSCLAWAGTLSIGEEKADQGELHVEFLGKRSYLTWYSAEYGSEQEGPYDVAPGEVFVVGDNRHNSFDSRHWQDGQGAGVPAKSIKGQALAVWLVSHPADGHSWQRIGLELRGRPGLPGLSPRIADGIERCLAKGPGRD